MSMGRDKTKKKYMIVPNLNMDQWIKFIINNLNQITVEYEWDWAESLLKAINEHQDEFNSGKFRGAIFNLNFINAEKKQLIKPETDFADALGTERIRDGKLTRTTQIADCRNLGRDFANMCLGKTG
jgi:hypothetical protein